METRTKLFLILILMLWQHFRNMIICLYLRSGRRAVEDSEGCSEGEDMVRCVLSLLSVRTAAWCCCALSIFHSILEILALPGIMQKHTFSPYCCTT